MKTTLITLMAVLCTAPLWAQYRSIPREPMEIGFTAHFFVDDYLVDNRWAVNYGHGSREQVLREFHVPQKYEKNPVMISPREGPDSEPQAGPAWINVIRDEATGMFKMWYTDNQPRRPMDRNIYDTFVCYAESKDGQSWTLPKLGIYEYRGSKENNIVWRGMRDGQAGAAQIITQVPPEARRGYKYLLLYLAGGGIQLVGSHDGVHWDKSSNQVVHPMASDFPNNILYDAATKEYTMYCRSKTLYLVGGNRDTGGNPKNILDVGESRRVARVTNGELWATWKNMPQQILQSDELDNVDGFTAIYSFTVQHYGDVFWGFTQPFRWNNWMHAELSFSRDGERFDRLPTRPKLIARGPEGSWDSGIIMTAYNWVEVGNEWWLYYNGWDGPHGVQEMRDLGRFRTGGVGLVKVRKEGFISMRGPKNGGVLCTRRILWPGGGLVVNADAREGELKVRISDDLRKPLDGFNYADCNVFTGNSTAHEITWKGGSLEAMKGKVIRLEIFLKNADIYTFRAAARDNSRRPADVAPAAERSR